MNAIPKRTPAGVSRLDRLERDIARVDEQIADMERGIARLRSARIDSTSEQQRLPANGGTEAEGGRMLSLMLVAGAVGTLVLGPVADRVGLRRTLLVTQAALPFLIVTFVAVGFGLTSRMNVLKKLLVAPSARYQVVAGASTPPALWPPCRPFQYIVRST